MRILKFSRLCLLSQNERSGLIIKFTPSRNLIVAANQKGKSAIMKSLYEAFGTQPHKVDKKWQKASVSTLLEITINNQEYVVLRTAGYTSVYSEDRGLLIESSSSDKLSRFWSEILDFGMLIGDEAGNPVSPSCAHIFAPFYMDQDKSWSSAWNSFKELTRNQSKRSLAEYHIGLKSREYYIAWAQMESKKTERKKILRLRDGAHQALSALGASMPDVKVSLDLSNFESQVTSLIKEFNTLMALEELYKAKIAGLKEEKRIWQEQRDIATAALCDMDDSIRFLIKQPKEIFCPTCGNAFSNSSTAQFGLVKDQDSFIHAANRAKSLIKTVDLKIARNQNNLTKISEKLVSIRKILSFRKSGVQLIDVIRAKGKFEADSSIRARIASLDSQISGVTQEISELKRLMEHQVSQDRVEDITSFFSNILKEFCKYLDVSTPENMLSDIMPPDLGRGSTTPRSLFAYYFAVIATGRRYSVSPRCPIVVDAPNQQGQDEKHIERIMHFMFEQQPKDAQVIVASEGSYDLKLRDDEVFHVGSEGGLVLDTNQYERAMEVFRPYLGALI
ncbi:hypothetical protein [Azospirillum thiophilum]|uniref:hypothetical protein n=2 Tax=Azospirillum thiophilum TaxID=528244 RepID=UPI000B309A65|nr:hypothetical protein [Azospirillum thiophilum]